MTARIPGSGQHGKQESGFLTLFLAAGGCMDQAPGWQGFARRIDAFFDHLYARLGDRYLTVMRYSVVVPIYVAAAAFAAVFVSYLDASSSQKLRSLVIGHVILLAVVALHMAPGGKRLTKPVDDWLAAGRPAEGAMAAWEAARDITSGGFWLSLRSGLLVGVLSLAYATVEFSLGLVDVAVIAHGFTMAMIGIVAVLWPFTEMYHRPVRRDLARRIGDALPDVTVRFPIGGRLLLTGAAIGIMTGAVVAYAARSNASLASLGRLGILVFAIAFTISLLPIFLLSRSLLAPLEDLLTATRRVGSGDLETRVDITTNDEIGVLAHAFNEMVGQMHEAASEVQASRARIVAASDAERKRVERNIHDGAQQQLTALALHLELLRENVKHDADLQEQVMAASAGLRASLDELRELARGLHPSILSTDGLAPALEQLADRAPVPVKVSAAPDRLGEATESTAYFVASEAMANMAKYANATAASIQLACLDGQVILEVRDDGVGGAEFLEGSGLRGILDRVEAVGGRLIVHSPVGKGTLVRAELPIVDALR